MKKKKKLPVKKKIELHRKNRHHGRYNFEELTQSSPELSEFVKKNEYNDLSIDFFNPEAVKALNKALLMHYYDITNWDIPQDYLIPPIPGRADYIHHIAELLGNFNDNQIPVGEKIKCIDIGIGASCIYPIIGVKEYGWSFVGSDIDKLSLENSQKIIDENKILENKIELRFQDNAKNILSGIIKKGENYDLTICNPPFHSSAKEANAVALKKLSNLKKEELDELKLNFAGKNHELWCYGGESKFVQDMILQSKDFSESCFWFSTVISKQSNLAAAYNALEKVEAKVVKTLKMGQGNKKSRILAWSFLDFEKRRDWVQNRWLTKE